jgi:hypothetical protein
VSDRATWTDEQLLEAIREDWRTLRKTKPRTPAWLTLMHQIREMSDALNARLTLEWRRHPGPSPVVAPGTRRSTEQP